MNIRIFELPADLKSLIADWPVIVTDGREILVDNDQRNLPKAGELFGSVLGSKVALNKTETKVIQVGRQYFADLGHLPIQSSAYSRITNRAALDMVQQEASDFLRGLQLIQWFSQTSYCANCGQRLQLSENEFAKTCNACSKTAYPTISPAVIGVILKKQTSGNQILLAKGPAPRKFYSCIAGFVEAGETLEEAFRREVFEEVGLDIGDIRYFGSQPWPFPSQLMIGFIGEWRGGEIKINKNELTDAAWFSSNNLPELPSEVSIARQLINHAVKLMSS